MDEKNELNNIILDQDSNKLSGIKKVVVVIATLSIVLIFVLVIMNKINSDDGQTLPKPTLPPTPNQSLEFEDEDPLFESVSTTKDEDVNIDDSLRKITTQLKEQTSNTAQAVSPNTDKDDDIVIEEDAFVRVPSTSSPKEVSKPEIPPEIEKPKVTQTPKQQTTDEIRSGYYIQVGSFSRTPNKKFIAKIESYNYTHAVQNVKVNGKSVNRLMIGPYTTRDLAKRDLLNIKNKLNKDAYIRKVR